jgi:hypothetical protein
MERARIFNELGGDALRNAGGMALVQEPELRLVVIGEAREDRRCPEVY